MARVLHSSSKKNPVLFVLSVCALAACDKPAPMPGSHALRPPFDLEKVQQNVQRPYTSKFTCKAKPEPIKDLFFESIYGENKYKNSSIVSPKAYKAYKEATKSINEFESGIALTANRYLRSSPTKPEIAICVMDWITYWADHDAFLGKANSVGEFVRKWSLASISLAYMQVRNDPSIQKHVHEKAQTWIADIANTVISDFSRGPNKASRRNNHMYWAAWGVAAAGMALDNDDMFDWAMRQAKLGIYQIQDDGTLPLELHRGRKAFNYHHYAAIPLFLMAEAGKVNGVDLFAENHEGLRRLARVLLENMDDQAYFEDKTGEKQNLDRTLSSSNLTWMEIYYKYYKDPDALRWLEKFRPMKQSRAGGDVTLLYTWQDVPKKKKKEK